MLGLLCRALLLLFLLSIVALLVLIILVGHGVIPHPIYW